MIFSKDNSNETSVTADSANLDEISESIENPELVSASLVQESKTSLRPSILSEGFEFVGELKAPHGNLTIDGTFKGTLVVKSVVIGQAGQVDGNVKAELITLKGQLKGTVDAEELVITSRAVLDGTTTYHDLTIARGAQVLGELKRR